MKNSELKLAEFQIPDAENFTAMHIKQYRVVYPIHLQNGEVQFHNRHQDY